MSGHLGLVAARMHAVLAVRPGSDVFHVYAGPRSRVTGRIPRGARAVGNCRTRQLHELERDGSVLDLGGRRLCGRCSARLNRSEARAEQPVSHGQIVDRYRTVTLGDLVVALAICSSVAENRAIATVASKVHGFMSPETTRRPRELCQRQARYDFEVAVLAQRAALTAVERTDEERAANLATRENEAADRAHMRATQRHAARVAKAQDINRAGGYQLPWNRSLLDSA